jgi:hypothetical protein
MAEPYIRKDPGDIIRAQDWNDMQARVRGAIEGHTHTGAGQGPLLTGAAIDPAAALKVKSVTSDTLSVAGADLSSSLKALLERVNAALPLAGGTVTGELVARGGIRLADADIGLRAAGDNYHGLGFYGANKRFAGQAPDGPVLYGTSGGGLGSTKDEQRLALTWDAQQNVAINKALTVADSINAAGSDVYFTKTDHKHSGKGNAAGLAAIENATNFDALMILGRYGSALPSGATGRYVRLWDYLSVEGSMQVTGDLNVKGRVSSSLARAINVNTNKVETSSSKWEQLPDMKTSFNSTGGLMLLMFKTGGVQATPTGQKRVRFRMLLDGNERASCAHEFHNGGWELRDVNLMIFVPVAAGQHNLWVEWYLEGGGTAACCWYNDQRVLMGIEL